MDFPDSKINGPLTHLAKRDSNGYADAPGTGPAGEKCKTCAHIHGFQQSGRWFKCELRRPAWTGGRGTDIKANSPACSQWLSDGIDRSKKPAYQGDEFFNAISLHQPYANKVESGEKTLETRKWKPFIMMPFDLLICSTRSPKIVPPYGMALCVVTITGCRPMVEADEAAACCKIYPGAYAWQIENLRRIKHFSIKGMQLLFKVQKSKVEFIG